MSASETQFETGVAIYYGSKGLLHPVGRKFTKVHHLYNVPPHLPNEIVLFTQMLVAIDVNCRIHRFLNNASSSGAYKETVENF